MFEEADYEYLKDKVVRLPESEDPYWWEEDEVVYSTEDAEETDWSDDRLDCGCCACCGCSCYELEEEDEEGYTFDSELPNIYMSIYFDSNMYPDAWAWTDHTGGTEINGCWGDYDYNEEDFVGISEELSRFLAKTLVKGIFEVLVEIEVEYYQCNHPLDPEEWDSACYFEILDWRKVNA